MQDLASSDQAAQAAEDVPADSVPAEIASDASIMPREVEPGSIGFQTDSMPTTRSGDPNESATNKRGPKRATIWIGAAATLLAAIAISVLALSSMGQGPEPGSSHSPERLIPQNEFVNAATVGTCFVAQANQQILEKDCAEPGVLKVIKRAYSSAECNDFGAGGSIRADNTGAYVCWSRNA